jgi:hypothetical protein
VYEYYEHVQARLERIERIERDAVCDQILDYRRVGLVQWQEPRTSSYPTSGSSKSATAMTLPPGLISGNTGLQVWKCTRRRWVRGEGGTVVLGLKAAAGPSPFFHSLAVVSACLVFGISDRWRC